VPHDKIHPMHTGVSAVEDLPKIVRQAIEHFFETYKDLEPGTRVKIRGWGTRDDARNLIVKAIEAAAKH
jgi:inorganic pyrophosphatase